MALPLFVVLSLGTGLMATWLLAHVVDIATFAPQLATLIGLGVAIDYALFIVTRHRNAIKAGRSPEEACVRALNTSGRAVLFAGATGVVALLGLLDPAGRVQIRDGMVAAGDTWVEAPAAGWSNNANRCDQRGMRPAPHV